MGATSSAAHRPGPRRKDERQILNWFRYYIDTLDNPKVQSLPGELFKFWMNLLCLARMHDGILPDDKTITWRLRSTDIETTSALHQLEIRGLIEKTKGRQWTPHDWEEHQYASDSSTPRTKKHREKRSAERSRNVSGNGFRTPPETEQIQRQSRAERETSPANGNCPDGAPRFETPTHTQLSAQESAARMAALHPKPTNRVLIESALASAIDRGHTPERIESAHADWCASAEWTEDGGKWCPGLAKWMADDGFTKKPRKPLATAEVPQYFNLAEAREKDRKRKNGSS